MSWAHVHSELLKVFRWGRGLDGVGTLFAAGEGGRVIRRSKNRNDGVGCGAPETEAAVRLHAPAHGISGVAASEMFEGVGG